MDKFMPTKGGSNSNREAMMRRLENGKNQRRGTKWYGRQGVKWLGKRAK